MVVSNMQPTNSRGCFINTFVDVPNLFNNSLVKFFSHPFVQNLQHTVPSQKIRSGELKFLKKMFTSHHVSQVMCHMSRVMCLMSGVMCHFFSSSSFLTKWSRQSLEGLLSTGLPRLVQKFVSFINPLKSSESDKCSFHVY